MSDNGASEAKDEEARRIPAANCDPSIQVCCHGIIYREQKMLAYDPCSSRVPGLLARMRQGIDEAGCSTAVVSTREYVGKVSVVGRRVEAT